MIVYEFTLKDGSTFDGTEEELATKGISKEDIVKQNALYDDHLILTREDVNKLIDLA